MIQLTLQLLLAHLLGDFLFQPARWVEDKEHRKHKSKYMLWHIAVHAVLLVVLLQFDHAYWAGALVILVTHYFIDLGKLTFQNSTNRRLLFFIDQLAHLMVIMLVVFWYKPFQLAMDEQMINQMFLLATAILIVTVVSSVGMKVIFTKWTMTDDETNDSLNEAGKYIGMLERLFVFGFIVINQWQVIGFLLAAKSVFRFGDLSKAKDRKLTEYILIGTFLSFGIAILTGLAYSKLLHIISTD